MTDVVKENANVGRRRLIVLVPLIIFLGLVLLFLIRLFAGDPSRIPSALIGHPAPQTNLPAVTGLDRNGEAVPGLDPASFKGAVTVVNVWASWCVPCHDEAPLLMRLAGDSRVRIVGINYKDEPGKCPPLPRPLRQSVHRGRRRPLRPRRNRMGRLWRAGNLHRRPRRPHRL